MTTNLILISLGIVTAAWGRWLLPHQLRGVRQRATREGRSYYDDIVGRRGVSAVLSAPTVLGCMLVVLGVVFWLTE